MSIAPRAGGTDLGSFDFEPAAPEGAVYYKGPDFWTFEPPGTVGHFLQTAGAGAPPVWAPVPGGGDMLAAVYDPTAVVADVFNLDNHTITGGALGDLITHTAGTGFARLPAGGANTFLKSLAPGVTPVWAAAPGDMLQATYDPLGIGLNAFNFGVQFIPGQALGDLLVYTPGAPAQWARLPAGAVGEMLTVDGGGLPVWGPGGAGDMSAAVYDPTAIAASAFDLANFLIGGQAQGDIYYRAAAAWARLAAGAVGQVLTTNGPGADPSWTLPVSFVAVGKRTTQLTNTTTTYAEYLKVTTPIVEAGDYLILWMVVGRNSSTGGDWRVRVQVDDTVELINPGDPGDERMNEEGIDGGGDQRYVRMGFGHETLTNAAHDIDIDLAQNGAGTARLYHGVALVLRVG